MIFSAIRNPGAFYFAAAQNDWTSPQNNALWQDEVKTLFDPCPAGWRVPRSGSAESGCSPWSAFTPESAVWRHEVHTAGASLPTPAVVSGGEAWFPASGFRPAASGFFGNVDVTGYQYTSSAGDGIKAFYLGVYTGKETITPFNYNNLVGRGNGFPVRCVRE